MRSTLIEPALYEATRRGLHAEPKRLPTVWLYDERGSRLYEEITRLPEYYLPRREREILRARAAEIAARTRARTRARTLVELGAGAAKNTRLLLDALDVERFVPVDVSEQALHATAETIAAAHPRISVEPLVGDFERDLDALSAPGPRLVALLGSTIGNLYPGQRTRLLTTLGEEDSFLVGLDLVTDVTRLEAAYDNPVTETFVRNALTAANRELHATFDQRRFAYEARWDPEHEWMDIGFRARRAHTVSIPRLELDASFEEDERLRVEISAKFRRERFALEAARAGRRLESWWTDPRGDFAVALLTRRKERPWPFAAISTGSR
jgi:L-histidine Nalpha-methyltransferase